MLQNKAAEMEIFVRVYETGGFSAAARTLALTPSAIAKSVARLEQRLGTTLFHRSTRSLRASAEGEIYYERARAILSEIEAADSSVGQQAVAARGRIRVNSTIPFGTHVLLPRLGEFLKAHPEVTLDLSFTDDVIDLLAERTDVAIRVGNLKDSRLMKRKLGSSPLLLVASPAYLKEMPPLRKPADLARHNCLNFNFRRQIGEITLLEKGARNTYPAPGNVLVNNGESMRHLILAGIGIGRLAHYHVAADLAAGRLVEVLRDFDPQEKEDIHAVFLGAGGRFSLPVRTRLFIDFVAVQARLCLDGTT